MEIRFEKLTKIFVDKTRKETRAVDALTLTIPSGKLVSLLGPSGCGKSTTLFMVAGLHEPTSGKIFFGDEEVTRLSPDKRGIGLVFQNYALYPHMTIRNNILFPLENANMKRGEAMALVEEMAKLVGIEDQLDKKPGQLSGGQQQRVAIARALVKKPRVLLLDEPLSNLDARLRLQTREEIRRIQKETGITTIFVTHDQEEAMSISDTMVVLNNGLMQQTDAPQEMYLKPKNLFVAKFLGNPPINVIKEVEVKNDRLYIDGALFLENVNAKNGKYIAGIRPEDFKVGKAGYKVGEHTLSVTGRDTMIHFSVAGNSLRALVDSEEFSDATELVLTVKPEKIHLFNQETEEVVKR